MKREERKQRGSKHQETTREGRAEGPRHRKAGSGQNGDSLEKALSRRPPRLLGTGGDGTVAGAVSGRTTLRRSQGMSEQGPQAWPPPPTWPLTSSPRDHPRPCLRLRPHRPALG